MALRTFLKPLLLAATLATAGNALADAPAGAPPVPLLWKVSDADNAVYLLGSFHLLKPSDYPLSQDAEAAFADAKAVVFEVDPADLTSPETLAKFQRAAGYQDGKTLSQVLPADVKQKLEQVLAVSGGSLAQVEGSEPWAITMGMMIGMAQAAGFRQEQGMDMHFIRRAAEAGKPVSGLETIDDQIAALDGAPHDEQAYSLGELLKNPQESVTELLKLHTMWRAGDAGGLDGEFRHKMKAEIPVSYRLVNTERNEAWVPRIAQRLEQPGRDNTLFVVGALHLLGEDGVVEKLRARGYAVERICSACAKGGE